MFFDPRCIEHDKGQLVNFVQMGDGAGAVAIGPDDGSTSPRLESLFFGTLGPKKTPGFSLKLGGSGKPFSNPGENIHSFDHDYQHIRESGPELFDRGIEVAREIGIDVDNVTWVLPHQANAKIGKVLAPRLGIPPEKFVINADIVGNTGSAAIWIALHNLRKSGKLRDGNTVLVLGAEASKFMYGGFLYRHAN